MRRLNVGSRGRWPRRAGLTNEHAAVIPADQSPETRVEQFLKVKPVHRKSPRHLSQSFSLTRGQTESASLSVSARRFSLHLHIYAIVVWGLSLLLPEFLLEASRQRCFRDRTGNARRRSVIAVRRATTQWRDGCALNIRFNRADLRSPRHRGDRRCSECGNRRRGQIVLS